MNTDERPAKGVVGYLLLTPDGEYIFRVYNDPDDRRDFTDYRLAAEEVKIEVLSGNVSLAKMKDTSGEFDVLTWSSTYH